MRATFSQGGIIAERGGGGEGEKGIISHQSLGIGYLSFEERGGLLAISH